MGTRTARGCVTDLLLLIVVVGLSAWEGRGQGDPWIEWEEAEVHFTPKQGYSQTYVSFFEASPNGRWVVQRWHGVQVVEGEPPDERYEVGIKGMRVIEPIYAVIWEVGGDGQLARRIWSSEDKNFLVGNAEWVRDELLLSVLPGVRHSEDFGSEDIPLLQVLAVQPQTGGVRRFADVPASIILANKAGDRVLLGGVDWYGNRGEQWFKVYTYPGGSEIAAFRFEHPLEELGTYLTNSRWSNSYTSDTLLGWADREHLWAIGKRKGPKFYPTLPPATVSVLLSIDLTGKVHFVSGDPKRCWVQWPGVVLAGETGGLRYYAMRPQILGEGQVAVMLGREPRLAFFSPNRLRKEYWFEPERYPQTLQRMIEERRAKTRATGGARVLAITLDGKRLILQEGVSEPKLDRGELLRVRVWDVETNAMEGLTEVDYIDQVYGWLGQEYLMVRVERRVGRTQGGQMPLMEYRYGVIRVPEI